jgi:hypothetical protein
VLRNKRSADIVSGLFLAALGLTAVWASAGISEGAGGHLHPRTFPFLLGVLLAVGGAGLALRAWLSRPGEDKPIAWPDSRGWKYLAIALGSLALYVALSGPLGFLISTFLFITGFIWYFGRYNPLVAAAYALGVVAFIYFVFVRLLQLMLPLGPLSFLYS